MDKKKVKDALRKIENTRTSLATLWQYYKARDSGAADLLEKEVNNLEIASDILLNELIGE
jgi:hypothetical protein